ncbi:MAG: efflux RND transporter periplasmic adaptor subunit [Myxococcales bacterium]|nr:efflux RND transporter periplasmic adaptor subunit [Myxococcales bacterium]
MTRLDPQPRMKVLLPIAILGVAVLVVLVVKMMQSSVDSKPAQVLAHLVSVIEAQPRDIQYSVYTHGTVVPRTESDLIPQVAGEVVWVSPTLVSGGFFEKGDPLIRIDPSDHRVELEAARAVVARTKSEFARTKTEIERQRSLAVEGVASQARIDDAENAFRVTEAELREETAKLARAERDLERTEIRAPYQGRVRSETVDVGQFVSRGVPIGKLYATDYAEVRLPLPDRDLRYLDIPFDLSGRRVPSDGDRIEASVGAAVRLRAEFAGEPRTWIGQIVRTEGEIDAKSRMVHLVARVEDPYGQNGTRGSAPLAVGLFVEAEIQGRRVEGVFVLPRTALRNNSGDDFVYVVDAGDRLRFKAVEVLRAERDDVVIGGGLEPGDRGCISPMAAPVNGMAVRVVRVAEDENRLGQQPQSSGNAHELDSAMVQRQ